MHLAFQAANLLVKKVSQIVVVSHDSRGVEEGNRSQRFPHDINRVGTKAATTASLPSLCTV